MNDITLLIGKKITAVAAMACFKQQKVTSSVVIQTCQNKCYEQYKISYITQ